MPNRRSYGAGAPAPKGGTPYFSVENRVWLDAGGIYVLANLRGGGEFGEEWHLAGNLTRKQNVFDDMIGAAQHLIERGYTKPQRLAAIGGSNGGLLMGASSRSVPISSAPW
jgi:prolyl oligopeptidase